MASRRLEFDIEDLYLELSPPDGVQLGPEQTYANDYTDDIGGYMRLHLLHFLH